MKSAACSVDACPECGNGMLAKREDVSYRSLPSVVLVDVEVRRCPACSEYIVVIPFIDKLNDLLAKSLIDDRQGLGGAEVKFLRKYLGYSSTDFAKAMGIGITSATVSRWERSAQRMSRRDDLRLRALVILGKEAGEEAGKEVDDSIDSFVDMATEDAPDKSKTRFWFTPVSSSRKWAPAAARA